MYFAESNDDIKFRNVSFTRNRSSKDGGAVYFERNNTNIQFIDCLLKYIVVFDVSLYIVRVSAYHVDDLVSKMM